MKAPILSKSKKGKLSAKCPDCGHVTPVDLWALAHDDIVRVTHCGGCNTRLSLQPGVLGEELDK